MNRLVWLVAGIAVGFLAARQLGMTARGRAFFDDLDRRAKEFSDSLVEGYREREAELKSAIADES
jgi:uncharacterized membrane-anchored protein YhcB (DUF1043 family)